MDAVYPPLTLPVKPLRAPAGHHAPMNEALSPSHPVRIVADRVVLSRKAKGIAMLLTVPARSYRGVAIDVVQRGEADSFEIILLHEQAGLNAPLLATSCEHQARTLWAATGKSMSLPLFVASPEGGFRPLACARADGPPCDRRRGEVARRSRFARRRRLGDPARLAETYAGEREIIARD